MKSHESILAFLHFSSRPGIEGAAFVEDKYSGWIVPRGLV